MGFYNTGNRGTISGPSEEDFDPEAACKKLNDGMKGLGTDENAIIDVLPKHTNEQRQEIKKKYKTMYGKELVDVVEKELGGSFAKVVLGLLQEPEDFIVDCVQQSIKGLGTNEYALIGLLCVRTNDELQELKTHYKEKHGNEMEDDISDDLSGDMKTLIVGLINAGRDESDEIDAEKVKQDAKDLLDAAAGAGTKEEVFAAIFNQRSPSHMRDIFDAYKDMADGKELEETIESEFSGSLKNTYLAMIKIFRNIVAFHAERLRAAIKGAGTDDDVLIQIFITRSEIDLKDIIEFYEAKYESRLVDDVSADTSGDYKLLLQAILDESPNEEGEDAEGSNEVAVANGDQEDPAEVEESVVDAKEVAETEAAPESEEAVEADESGDNPKEEGETDEAEEKQPEAEESAPNEEEEAPTEEAAADSEPPADSEDPPTEAKDDGADSGEAPGEEEAEVPTKSDDLPATSEDVQEPPAESDATADEAEEKPSETQEESVEAESGAAEEAGANNGTEDSEGTQAEPGETPADAEDEGVEAEGNPDDPEDTASEFQDATGDVDEDSHTQTDAHPAANGGDNGDDKKADQDTENSATEDKGDDAAAEDVGEKDGKVTADSNSTANGKEKGDDSKPNGE